MAAEDLLRLAWEADHDGRRSLRDALMTLAITESGPGDDWPERCRARLLSERPGHYLGAFASIRQAQGDPRVVANRDRLRAKYPPERVGWLLLRARAARGSYTGRVESLGAMIEDLVGPKAEAENVRLDAPEAVRGPLSRARSARPAAFAPAHPPMSGWFSTASEAVERPELDPGPESAGRRFHHVSILFAIAMLLAAMPGEDVDGPVAG